MKLANLFARERTLRGGEERQRDKRNSDTEQTTKRTWVFAVGSGDDHVGLVLPVCGHGGGVGDDSAQDGGVGSRRRSGLHVQGSVTVRNKHGTPSSGS
jgi:hypothetical protein